MDDLFNNTFAYNSDRRTLIDNKSDSRTQIFKPKIIYYGDIDFFFLRNLNNPERDILITEINFRNLKDRLKNVDG
jgi:hypothetical protein